MDVFGIVASAQEKYLRAAVLRAALELQLWPALPATAAEAARALGARSPRRLCRLLEALALFGFARREGEVFHPLVHPAPGPVPDAGWGRLAEVIRTDRPVAEPGVSGDDAPEALRRFHDYLFEAGGEPAREMWDLIAQIVGGAPAQASGLRLQASGLRPEFGPLLDLGGGAGAYAAAFPGEGTLVDTAAVLRLARAPRARLLALDLLSGVYPGEQGVALLANVLHLFGAAECRALISKAAAAVRRGGLLVVKDLEIDAARTGPPQSVLFALNMALFTEAGDVHPAQAVEAWLRDAGLGAPRRLRLRTSPGSLVLACAKP